jgi:AraC-like DNA-binding protein
MTFDRALCDSRLAGASPEVARVNDRIIDETLARLRRAQTTDRVRAMVVEHLPSGEPSQAAIARAIGASTRALQRRLASEGTTYAHLVDDTRRELALAHVREARYSLTEIAYLLGFATPGTFTRAFLRWTGAAPSEHRRAAATHG